MTTVPGLIIAAPSSGSGKTVITLGLLRALRDHGTRISGAKAGPDYIDPAFHSAATGRTAHNLDPWGMRPGTVAALIEHSARDTDLIIAEGVMGLFDGANLPGRPDAGSTADLAAQTGWPVVLVIDAAKQAGSVAALVSGFANHRADVKVAGVILNRVGSESHEQVLWEAISMTCPGLPILAAVRRDPALALPERHLGLIQAGEHDTLESFIATAGRTLSQAVDLDALISLARPTHFVRSSSDDGLQIPILGQRIAVARDDAFAFSYASVLNGWRASGSEISFFSPLADEAPAPDADAIYLAGGYPELYAAQLSRASRFRQGLQDAAARKAAILGECGGYMVLGKGLIDAEGKCHEMTGLLPVETSFAARKLHLGYRVVETVSTTVLGSTGRQFRGHEFHYASITSEADGTPLFDTANARGDHLGPVGMTNGNVSGSFIHLIDQVAT